MKEIALTRGQYALVDDEDYERVTARRWHAVPSPWAGFYARSRGGIYMHRFVLSAPPGVYVDHINHNGLDNRRSCNIRLCTPSQNIARARYPVGPSGFRGVYWDEKRGKYRASIKTGGRIRNIGRFPSAEEAASAYDRASIAMFGEFANLNFPKAQP